MGIKITYSWGDEENIIPCTRDNAWEKMCELAGRELYAATTEEEDIDLLTNASELCITLHYHCDDEYCYYRFQD